MACERIRDGCSEYPAESASAGLCSGFSSSVGVADGECDRAAGPGCSGRTGLDRITTMPPFVLLHGSGQHAGCWERVGGLLEARGHVVAAPDLPKQAPDWRLGD